MNCHNGFCSKIMPKGAVLAQIFWSNQALTGLIFPPFTRVACKSHQEFMFGEFTGTNYFCYFAKWTQYQSSV